MSFVLSEVPRFGASRREIVMEGFSSSGKVVIALQSGHRQDQIGGAY
jgi:hypothetical protein